MREIPTTAVFSHADALRLGWTHSALKHAVAIGRLVRLRRGMYTSIAEPGPIHAAIAASLSAPNAVVSHRSAALLHGLPLFGPPPPIPELTTRPRGPGNVPGVHLHRAGMRRDEVCDVAGLAVTSVARTLVDLARTRSTATAVVAMDAALHDRWTTPDHLDRLLVRCWNWPGIRRAQRSVGLANGGSESPLESVSRLVLGWLGLPTPLLQATLRDARGRFLGRSDFYWDEFGVVGEADGRSKYDARPVITAEKDRQEALEDAGLVVIRWQWEHPTRRPHELREKILRGFERGALRDRSGFPRLWTLSAPPNGYN